MNLWKVVLVKNQFNYLNAFNMTLTVQEKINILENIDWRRMENTNVGLCFVISRSVSKLIINYNISYYSDLDEYIDLFTEENSKRFAIKKTDTMYWFDRNPEGYIQRKEFVDWMILEYKKQL